MTSIRLPGWPTCWLACRITLPSASTNFCPGTGSCFGNTGQPRKASRRNRPIKAELRGLGRMRTLHRPAGGFRIALLVPLLARDRALTVGVGLDQACIDRDG